MVLCDVMWYYVISCDDIGAGGAQALPSGACRGVALCKDVAAHAATCRLGLCPQPPPNGCGLGGSALSLKFPTGGSPHPSRDISTVLLVEFTTAYEARAVWGRFFAGP